MSSSEYPEYVAQNIESWTRANAEYTDDSAARAWAQEEITWGVFSVPESELNLLGDVDGLDVYLVCGECGTEFKVSRLGELQVPRHCGEKMQVVRRVAEA